MARSSRSAAPPDATDPNAMADWAELTLLSQSSRRMSRAELRSAVREAMMLPDEEVEVAVEFVFREIRRRMERGAAAYPFAVDGGGIRILRAEGALAYVFMLCVSASSLFRAERRQQEVDQLFDSLVLDALRTYMGPTAEVLRFGWPATDGRPTDFYGALDWLSTKMRLDRGASRALPNRKDGGVDVVAWKPFPDGRSGFVSLLAQCTVQMDWTPKATDVISDVWNGWIDFGRMPLTCLAVPHAVPTRFEKWDEIRRTVHFLLERFRLSSLLQNSHLSRKTEIEAWVHREIARLSRG
jgi:hypothetical protein